MSQTKPAWVDAEERLAWDRYFCAALYYPDAANVAGPAHAAEIADEMIKLRRQRYDDRSETEGDEMKPDQHVTVIDIPALRDALETLRAHRPIIDAAMMHLDFVGSDGCVDVDAVDGVAPHEVIEATLEHIVVDGFRLPETRGES